MGENGRKLNGDANWASYTLHDIAVCISRWGETGEEQTCIVDYKDKGFADQIADMLCATRVPCCAERHGGTIFLRIGKCPPTHVPPIFGDNNTDPNLVPA